MAWTSLSTRLNTLPLILCGPIIRRAEKTNVSVWFILKETRAVTLNIYAELPPGTPLLSGSETKGIKLGEHVFAYCVTARGSVELEPRTTYYYDIDFGGGRRLALENDILPGTNNEKRFTYGIDTLPSFVLPPHSINEVRILHGSCRKTNGEGEDALEGIDTMLKQSLINDFFSPVDRPQQMYFTGDQIYADDVSDIVSHMINDAGNVLFDWDEDLTSGIEAEPQLFFSEEELKPGKRNKNDKLFTATGFTAMLEDIPECSKSHLMRFRDYACMYLFVWSDVLWSPSGEVPTFEEIFPGEPTEEPSIGNNPMFPTRPTENFLTYRFEKAEALRMQSKLPNIRRGMANIPIYMVIDDHDVTDDWNLNWHWCREVYSKDLGRHVIRNALLAAAVFQGWGNTPEQYEGTNPGRRLIKMLDEWRGEHLPNMEPLLNIRAINSISDPEDFTHKPDTISWHFSYDAENYLALFLDTRTWRRYVKGDPVQFTGPITKLGFDVQVPAALPDKEMFLIIVPTPVIGVPFLEGVQSDTSGSAERASLDADNWGFNEYTYEKLFAVFASRLPVTGPPEERIRRGRFAFLSGDVHYGLSARHQLWGNRFIDDPSDGIETKAVFAQLTASSFKNYLSKKCCHGNTFCQQLKSQWANTEQLQLTGYPISKPRGLFNALVPFFGQLGANALPEPEEKFGFRIDNEADRVVGKRLGSPNLIDMKVENVDGVKTFSEEELRDKKVVSIARKDWVSYTNWIIAEKNSDDSVTPTGVHAEPTTEALKTYLSLAKDHGSHYLDRWGDGKEIVGYNNFGEIRFEFSQDTKILNHTIWWRMKGSNSSTVLDLFPLSTFKIALNFEGDKDSLGNEIKEPKYAGI